MHLKEAWLVSWETGKGPSTSLALLPWWPSTRLALLPWWPSTRLALLPWWPSTSLPCLPTLQFVITCLQSKLHFGNKTICRNGTKCSHHGYQPIGLWFPWQPTQWQDGNNYTITSCVSTQDGLGLHQRTPPYQYCERAAPLHSLQFSNFLETRILSVTMATIMSLLQQCCWVMSYSSLPGGQWSWSFTLVPGGLHQCIKWPPHREEYN